MLLHAFRTIHQRDGRYTLHLAGVIRDHYQEAACQEFLRANGLHGAVFLEGPQPDLLAWLRDKDFMLSAGLGDGRGRGIMEAMASSRLEVGTARRPALRRWKILQVLCCVHWRTPAGDWPWFCGRFGWTASRGGR